MTWWQQTPVSILHTRGLIILHIINDVVTYLRVKYVVLDLCSISDPSCAHAPPDLLTTYIFDEVPTTTRVPSLDTSKEVAAPVKVVVPEASMMSTSVEVPITLTSPFPETVCTDAQ